MPVNSTTSITDFINGFNGGTRPNRFQVYSSNARVSRPFHVRSAQIPGSAISAIPLNWFGRTIELPGERVYQPWVITVLDDTLDQELYSELEAWQHAIGNKDVNTFVNLTNAFSTITTTANKGCNFEVWQYRSDNDTVDRKFRLYNVWPVQLGAMEYDHSVDGVLHQYTVTFMYSHFDYLTA